MTIIDEANSLISRGEILDIVGTSIDLLSDVIEAVQGNPLSIGKIILTLTKSPFLIREKLFWSKLERYLNGVYISEEDRAKLRAKLVENGSCDENAKRLIECIDRAETIQKIQYLINATRCFLTDFIDRTTFFRICRAITGTMDEDLLFLRDHISESNFESNSNVQGLFVSGLVTFSVIGGEQTLYSFTPIASLVDQYAISYDNIGRYPDPNVRGITESPNIEIPTATVDEVNEMLDFTFGEKQSSKINVELPMGEF